MQLVSSRIWTRVAVPISFDGNHYTTGIQMHNDILTFQSKVYLLANTFYQSNVDI